MVKKLSRTWIDVVWIAALSAEESRKSHEPVPNLCCMNPDSTMELPQLYGCTVLCVEEINPFQEHWALTTGKWQPPPNAGTGILALAAFR